MANPERPVLIISPGGLAQRGGMGQAVRNLVAACADLPDAPSWRVIDPWGPEHCMLMPFYWLWALLRVLWLGLRGQASLIHVHMAGGGSVLRKGTFVWLGSWLRIPVIVHVHAADLDEQIMQLPGLVRKLLRQMLHRARFVIVLGRYWHGVLVTRLGLDAQRLVVVPNGVPHPPLQPRDPISNAPCHLLFLGRLGERKGAPELLQALADSRLQALRWTVTMAGDGDVRGMREYADKLGLGPRCTLPGWVDRAEIERLLSEAEIFVLPSRQEGLPVAILEAMAYGLAIVTTRAGAIEDAITDGETGLLVPPGDPRQLADAILTLLTDHDLRRRLQTAARERYQQQFTVELFAERILQLYEACGLELARPGGMALQLPSAQKR